MAGQIDKEKTMSRSIKMLLTCLTLVLGILIAVRGAEAQPQISSELLLPYFEVELDPAGRTTLFAVGNALDEPVDILVTLHTNWGIALEKASLTLGPREVKSFNLRDWLSGSAPARKLDSKQVAHLKAALSGQRSPQDSLFYSTEIKAGLAVGYVRIKTQKTRPAALWGDYFIVDAAEKSTQGEALVALGQAGCPGLCARHILRYLLGGGFDGGTEVIVWTEKAGKPSRQASADQIRVTADSDLYNEAGDLFDGFRMRTLPVQQITLRELAIKQPFGWLDLRTEVDSFVAVRYRSKTSGSALLRTWCLPLGPPPTGPGIEITKLTNGEDANTAPGPSIPVGGAVIWEYIVRNTGDTVLTDIEVEDDQGVEVRCPKATLSKGESMTCSGRGTAVACQYSNLGTVTARTPDGDPVSDDDPSHYFGQADASIDLEKLTNGEDADSEPGLKIDPGAEVTWTYIVKNTGEVALSEIQVADDKEGAVSCPKRSLRPGESMTCTLKGKAVQGQYRNVGTASGETSCGTVVRDEDASHYHNLPDTVIDEAAIDIEKHTNGQDADTPKGPEILVGAPVLWEYIVTNIGETRLTNVQVTDNKGVAVSCPKTTLEKGASMTCTGHGTAQKGQYANLGTVTGKDPDGKQVTDNDPSHYFGIEPPKPASIDIEKHTNGQDADTPKGPEILVGAPVLWEYIVTNTGEVALSNVKVVDDQGVAVSCPKTSLVVGESMTCTGHGTAQKGQYANLGTVTGKDPDGKQVTDNDPSHYFGIEPPPPGDQGCTPGYWKNHADSWPASGYSTGQKVQSAFGEASRYPSFGSAALLDALSFQGGSGVEGGVGNLLRAATASLLNSSHPGVDFPRTSPQVTSAVNAALASGNRDQMLDLASALDADNNSGCPLN
jgi:hypothetical protein